VFLGGTMIRAVKNINSNSETFSAELKLDPQAIADEDEPARHSRH